MITAGMLKRQVWTADDDEFEYIVKNLQKVLRLNYQYKNHPYVEEFTKGCNVVFVYGTYVLEEETDPNFLWVIYGIYFRKTLYFRKANDKLYEGVELPTKNIRSSTEHRDHQASTWVNDGV